MDTDWEYSLNRERGCYEDPVDEVMSNIRHAYNFVDMMIDNGCIIINYEDFCNNPSSFILDIAKSARSKVCEKNLKEVENYIYPVKPFKCIGELEERILNAKERLFDNSETV